MWLKIAKLIIRFFWPEIKIFLAAYIRQLFAWIEQRLKDRLSQRNTVNSDKAEQAASDADKKAAMAASAIEAERYKAEAETWRKAAEMFRAENDALKMELEALRANGIENIERSLEALKFGDAFTVQDTGIAAKKNDNLFRIEGKRE